MESVHLQLPADLLARVDEAAGDIPRNRWIRRAIERALDAQPEFVPASTHNALVEAARAPEQALGHSGMASDPGSAAARRPGPAPAEQPVAEAIVRAAHMPRSSSQAKRDVRPIPKGGKS